MSTSKLPVSSFGYHSLSFSFFRNPRPWSGCKSVSVIFISSCGQLLTEIKSEVVHSEIMILSLSVKKITTHILSSLGSQNSFIHLVHKGKIDTVVHSKMKILSLGTHPRVILNP